MLVWNGESPTFRLQHEILRYLWRAERAAKFLTVAGWVLGLGPAGDAGSWVLGLPGRLGLGSWGQGPRPVLGVKWGTGGTRCDRRESVGRGSSCWGDGP